MASNETVKRVTDAQLWWDDDDWCGKYYVDGIEHHIDTVTGERDDSLETLAPQIANALDHLDDKVRVTVGSFGDSSHRGWVEVQGGKVLNWRAE